MPALTFNDLAHLLRARPAQPAAEAVLFLAKPEEPAVQAFIQAQQSLQPVPQNATEALIQRRNLRQSFTAGAQQQAIDLATELQMEHTLFPLLNSLFLRGQPARLVTYIERSQPSLVKFEGRDYLPPPKAN